MTEEKNAAIPPRLRNRKCPSCQMPIKTYVFVGIYCPIEGKAMFFAENFGKETVFSGIPFGHASVSEINNLYLASECIDCGFLSMWSFTAEELYFLMENTEKGYGMLWLYNPKTWKRRRDNITEDENSVIKKEITRTYEFIMSSYDKNVDKPEREKE